MRVTIGIAAALAAAILLPAPGGAEVPTKSGLPSLQRSFSDLTPSAVVKLGQTADWVEIAGSTVWVGSTGANAVHALDAGSRREMAAVALPGAPCAGLASGFGALWVPLCGAGDARGLGQIDLTNHSLIRVLPFGPDAEGGIAVGGDSVWVVLGSQGRLVRIDPKSGRIRQHIALPKNTFNPIFAAGRLWVTVNGDNRVAAINIRTGRLEILATAGPAPRFLTSGAGSIWVLNQGDGSVSRLDQQSGRLVATIALRLPGHGGDIAFGDGKVWITVAGVPLTAIDPSTNRPLRQWVGPGGDSLRVADGLVWLTDYDGGTVAAIPDPFD